MSSARTLQVDDVDPGTAEEAFRRNQRIGQRLDALESRAVWLDAEFRLPLTDIRIGVSSIVGFLPGIGDGAMMVIAATIVYHGMRLGAPTRTLVWMSLVLLVEGIVSVVPIVGDAVGVLWSANIGNVARLRRHQDSLDGTTNWLFVLLLLSPWIAIALAIGSLL